MDNFRTAWGWAIAHGEFSLIEQSIRPLAYFYDIRGWLLEGIEALNNVVTKVEISSPGRINQIALGHALASRALLESRLGLYEQARVGLERSLESPAPIE